MYEIIVLLYFFVAFGYLFWIRKRWFMNPVGLWVVLQILFFVGTLPNINRNIESDTILIYIMFGGLCCFIYGSLLVNMMSKTSRQPIKPWSNDPINTDDQYTEFKLLALLIACVSAVVGYLYFRAIGYNLFFESLRSQFTGQGLLDDVATLRLNTYTGSSYLAPGYVNQFKNILLPLLTAYLFARAFKYNEWQNSLYKLFLIALVPINILLLLGTGQRGAFTIAVVMVVYFFNVALHSNQTKVINRVVILMGITLFGMQTFFLARSAVTNIQSVGDVLDVGESIGERFFEINQLSALEGFRYIYSLPTQNGAGWMQELRGILPGRQTSVSLAKKIYAYRFGNTRGTSPPSIWGSIWYNFGVLGVVVVPFLMGVLYQGLYARLLAGKRSLPRLLFYSALTVNLGSWVISNPAFLLNNGLLAILLLGILMKIITALTHKRYSRYQKQVSLERQKAYLANGRWK